MARGREGCDEGQSATFHASRATTTTNPPSLDLLAPLPLTTIHSTHHAIQPTKHDQISSRLVHYNFLSQPCNNLTLVKQQQQLSCAQLLDRFHFIVSTTLLSLSLPFLPSLTPCYISTSYASHPATHARLAERVDSKIKLCCTGDGGVGKTCLLMVYSRQPFPSVRCLVLPRLPLTTRVVRSNACSSIRVAQQRVPGAPLHLPSPPFLPALELTQPLLCHPVVYILGLRSYRV